MTLLQWGNKGLGRVEYLSSLQMGFISVCTLLCALLLLSQPGCRIGCPAGLGFIGDVAGAHEPGKLCLVAPQALSHLLALGLALELSLTLQATRSVSPILILMKYLLQSLLHVPENGMEASSVQNIITSKCRW